jgi:hypothetical protein
MASRDYCARFRRIGAICSSTIAPITAKSIAANCSDFYIGFGLQTGTRTQVITEVTVALGFFGAALVGLWFTPWIIPAAYVMHGIWDYAHHQGSRFAPIPLWYPPFCAVADWVAAAVLAVIWGLRV